MRYAVINSQGVVVNVLWSETASAPPVPAGYSAIQTDSRTATAGAVYNNGVFTPPATIGPAFQSARSKQRLLDKTTLTLPPLIAAPTYAAMISAATAVAAGKIAQLSSGQLVLCQTGGTPASEPAFSPYALMTDGACVWAALNRLSQVASGREVPAISVSASLPGGLVAKSFRTNGGISGAPIFSNYPCPLLVDYAGVALQAFCMNIGTPSPTLVGLLNKWEFMTDAPKLAIGIWNNIGAQCHVYVDEYPIEQDVTSQIAGTPCYYIIDWSAAAAGARKLRSYRIEVPGYALTGVAVDAQSFVVAPTLSPSRLKGVWIGDSISNTTDGAGTYWLQLAEESMKQIGIAYTRNLSQPGMGYIEGCQTGTGYNGLQMLQNNQFVGWDADLVVFYLGHDDSAPAATVAAQALAAWQLARTQYPNAFIAILGIEPSASGPNATYIAYETALAATFSQWGDADSAYFPMSLSDSNQCWIWGTGKIGAPTGVGNSDFYLGPGGTHPSCAGRDYKIRRIALSIDAAMTASGL